MNLSENNCFNTIKILSKNNNALNVSGGTVINGDISCKKIYIGTSELWDENNGINFNNNIIPKSTELSIGNVKNPWDIIYTNELKIFGFAYCNYLNINNLNVENNISLGKINLNNTTCPIINISNNKINLNFKKLCFNCLENNIKIDFIDIIDNITNNEQLFINIDEKNNDQIITDITNNNNNSIILESSKDIIINFDNYNKKILKNKMGFRKNIFYLGKSIIKINISSQYYILDPNVKIIFNGDKWITYN